jgi:hypothetical protein
MKEGLAFCAAEGNWLLPVAFNSMQVSALACVLVWW